MPKTDEEIKEYIDSREVLSKVELSRFVYGYKSIATALIEKWWIYTLQTKNLKKLHDEKQKRINHDANKQKILQLLKTDLRLMNAGTRKQAEYLQKFYNIKVNRNSLQRWRKNNAKINQ